MAVFSIRVSEVELRTGLNELRLVVERIIDVFSVLVTLKFRVIVLVFESSLGRVDPEIAKGLKVIVALAMVITINAAKTKANSLVFIFCYECRVTTIYKDLYSVEYSNLHYSHMEPYNSDIFIKGKYVTKIS